ncbi:hypothetical protein SAMN05444266_11169 [Chitinophaga jiangningensis]|uniref:Uncharacterized protein n=1 Tax=Chitinophaga jiangningensis TaxID=1419482 RepID=A0A1M7LPC5_9BACT|nr:hypothetical protein [Chitinophaga jiangningensis]SHM80009.1 hypothetical protein SAMN05444266_11169 [Chitinophaga jiangningensis]
MKKVLIGIGMLSAVLVACQPNVGAEKADSTTDTIAGTENVVPAVTDTLQPVAEKVTAVLQKLYADDLSKQLIDSNSRRFNIAVADLNNDGSNEIFVKLNGGYFCGSGGCTVLLLNDQGTVITKFTVTDTPVSVSANLTNGWKDLLLPSNGKIHVVKYNGKAYPSNPSMQPAAGKEVTTAVPLLDNPAMSYNF